MNGPGTHEFERTPEDLREVERLLDRLGAAERASADAGLELRIASRTMPALRGAPALRLAGTGAEAAAEIATARMRGGAARELFTPMRLAAGLLIAGACVAVWIAGLSPTGGPSQGTVVARGPESPGSGSADAASPTGVAEALEADLMLFTQLKQPATALDEVSAGLDELWAETQAFDETVEPEDWTRSLLKEGAL